MLNEKFGFSGIGASWEKVKGWWYGDGGVRDDVVPRTYSQQQQKLMQQPRRRGSSEPTNSKGLKDLDAPLTSPLLEKSLQEKENQGVEYLVLTLVTLNKLVKALCFLALEL